MAEFLGGAKAARLFAYVDGGDALVVSQATPPAGSWSKLLAFVRDPSHAITPQTVATAVHFSVVGLALFTTLFCSQNTFI